MPPDLSPWTGLRLGERVLTDSNRSQVWHGQLGPDQVAIRQSTRSEPSLLWELELMVELDVAGFHVPVPVLTDDGRSQVGGLVVQRWIEGREPSTETDWSMVGAELQRLHEFGRGYQQRPGCCAVTDLAHCRSSVDADLDAMPESIANRVVEILATFTDVEQSVIHGDAWAPNLRIDDDGRVGLLDFDESRVDVVWHDLSNLGVQVLGDAEHARAQDLSNAWEAANGWQIENAYARRRLAALEPR